MPSHRYWIMETNGYLYDPSKLQPYRGWQFNEAYATKEECIRGFKSHLGLPWEAPLPVANTPVLVTVSWKETRERRFQRRR